MDITGREDKLRRVCGDDEGGDGLEEGVPAVLEAEVQQPQPEAAQGRVHQRRPEVDRAEMQEADEVLCFSHQVLCWAELLIVIASPRGAGGVYIDDRVSWCFAVPGFCRQIFIFLRFFVSFTR